VRVISFYLPQYHPIPENDEWWGAGFTDWVNVASSRPRFKGHHQPHIPADLGFYDLRLEETRIAQAEMASAYGVHGFCYYHYWFNDRVLLERPFNEVLESGKPNFPFCLCWANENWTRRWDGREKDVLIEQNYEAYDCEAHVEWLSKAFKDPRYIKVNDRPLFLVYNASAIPNVRQVIERWRKAAEANGLPGLYLCSVMSGYNTLWCRMLEFGFDACVEFFPTGRVYKKGKFGININTIISVWNKVIIRLNLDQYLPVFRSCITYSYKTVVKNAMAGLGERGKIFPCVMPSWDNSARRKINAHVYQNDDPKLYGKWLAHALNRATRNPPDEQLVFINAWNEWAEGCHLEPDRKHGRAFLEETGRVIGEFAKSRGSQNKNHV